MTLPITDGLILHLDASTLEGLDDNDSVTQWDDESASGLVLVPGAFTAPTFVETSTLASGLPGVSFNSNNSALEDASSVSLAGPRTIYFVAKMPIGDGNWRYFHPQGAGLLMVKGPGGSDWYFGSDGGGGQFITLTNSSSLGANTIVTFVMQTTGAFVQFDGASVGTGSIASVPSITTIRFGNVGGSAGGGSSWILHEFVMFSGVHDAGQIEDVEGYLFDKWFVEADIEKEGTASASVAVAVAAAGQLDANRTGSSTIAVAVAAAGNKTVSRTATVSVAATTAAAGQLDANRTASSNVAVAVAPTGQLDANRTASTSVSVAVTAAGGVTAEKEGTATTAINVAVVGVGQLETFRTATSAASVSVLAVGSTGAQPGPQAGTLIVSSQDGTGVQAGIGLSGSLATSGVNS